MLGATFGLRHAFEPDHLAAISGLAAEPSGRRRWLGLGASWGLGHAVTLLLAGGALAVLKIPMPAKLGDGLELGVAALIIFLGLRSLAQAYRAATRGPTQTHHHPGKECPHEGDHVHAGHFTLSWRPLITGAVHGLAGTGALTALVLSSLPDHTSRLLYITLFGLGAMGGMAALTGLVGLPLRRLGAQPRASTWLSYAAGLAAVGVGAWWGLGAMRAVLG